MTTDDSLKARGASFSHTNPGRTAVIVLCGRRGGKDGLGGLQARAPLNQNHSVFRENVQKCVPWEGEIGTEPPRVSHSFRPGGPLSKILDQRLTPKLNSGQDADDSQCIFHKWRLAS